jgi:hypothetical protein
LTKRVSFAGKWDRPISRLAKVVLITIDANLSVNLPVLIYHCNLRFALVEVDSEVVHGVASGVDA